jgi:Chalcone isomerase-like
MCLYYEIGVVGVVPSRNATYDEVSSSNSTSRTVADHHSKLLRLFIMFHRTHSKLIVSILLLIMFSMWEEATAATTSPDTVELPNWKHLDGVALKKNGHGVRSINVLGWEINVYVAGLYSAVPLLTEKDVLDSHGQSHPMQLDFTFLRTVDKGRVVSAWTQQLDHSVSYKYEGYETDRATFINLLSNKIENGGTQTVQLSGDKTVIVDQGVHKGDIVGRDFQRAFLSMWFGERAVADDLKANLLNGSYHLVIETGSEQMKSVTS